MSCLQTFLLGLYLTTLKANFWRPLIDLEESGARPLKLIQTRFHGPGYKREGVRTSSRTSPPPNPTSPQNDRNRCLQEPA